MSTDLTWVEKVQTVYANDPVRLAEVEADSQWRLIATGNGTCNWTTLTYGWPWLGEESGIEAQE